MTSIAPSRSIELRRRYARTLRIGLVLSVLAHVALFLIWRGVRLPPSPFSAAGPQSGDTRAAAGGGMQAVQLALTAPSAPARPPEPVPVPVDIAEPVPEPVPEVQPSVAAAPVNVGVAAGVLGLGDAGSGAGRSDGTGRGAGGTEAEGAFRAVPPSPRGLILPPGDRPRRVRGKQVAVWVFVDAAGDVVADSTRIDPGTGDRGFDRRLRELAAEWVFDPARKEGRAVAEWFRYVLVL